MSESSSPRRVATSSSDDDGLVTIVLSGEVDIATAPQFRAIADTATGNGMTGVLIDAADLTFIDSSGMSVIADLIRTTAGRDGRVTIRRCPRALRQLLEITGMKDLVDLDESS